MAISNLIRWIDYLLIFICCHLLKPLPIFSTVSHIDMGYHYFRIKWCFKLYYSPVSCLPIFFMIVCFSIPTLFILLFNLSLSWIHLKTLSYVCIVNLQTIFSNFLWDIFEIKYTCHMLLYCAHIFLKMFLAIVHLLTFDSKLHRHCFFIL